MRPMLTEFTQEQHCCCPSDTHPRMRLELHDGGGGEYLVLNATEWAMDTPEEIDMLAAEMKALLAKAKADPDAGA
jgi:hypothetical protein